MHPLACFSSVVYCRAPYVLESANDLVDVGGAVFVQLLVVSEDDDCDIDGAEDGKLVSLFEETTFALEEGHAAVAIIADYAKAVVLANQFLAIDEGEAVSLGLISIFRRPMMAAAVVAAVGLTINQLTCSGSLPSAAFDGSSSPQRCIHRHLTIHTLAALITALECVQVVECKVCACATSAEVVDK